MSDAYAEAGGRIYRDIQQRIADYIRRTGGIRPKAVVVARHERGAVMRHLGMQQNDDTRTTSEDRIAGVLLVVLEDSVFTDRATNQIKEIP